MSLSVIAELPEFDTGAYEGCEFLMSKGGAVLSLQVAGLPSIGFSFSKVRWHQFTALYNCTSEMVKDAYFRLVEYPGSQALKAFIHEDRATTKAYQRLSHYRIFLNETGCHELFAESASAL